MNQCERAECQQFKQELSALFSRQEAMLAVVPDVIIVGTDNHKIYRWVNQAGLAFFGDDAIGREAAFYLMGEETACAAVLPPSDDHPGLIRVQSWQRRRDGEKRLLAWQCRALKDANGNDLGYLSSARDITEQKREEERLQKIEERWLAITESTQDAILIMDPEGRVSYWNRAAEGMFGHARGEAIGKDLHDLIVPSRFHSAFHSAYQKFLQTGQGAGIGKILDLEALRKNGQEISIQLSLSAIQINNGWHAIGLIRDTTERKHTENALLKKERLLSESQRLGHIGSFLFEMTGPIEWSEELYHLYGVSPDTFIPTVESFLNLIHPDDRQSMQEWIAGCAAGEKPGELDFRINRPDGTMRYVKGRGEVVLDTKKRPLFMAGTVMDITERKQADQEIQQYIAELAEKNNELQDALTDIKQLSGLLPICASCKKIRDDSGYWHGVETFIAEHSNAEFSHGICPECEKKAYEELDAFKSSRRRRQ
jgi:PAS domain S-box-containing protein